MRLAVLFAISLCALASVGCEHGAARRPIERPSRPLDAPPASPSPTDAGADAAATRGPPRAACDLPPPPSSEAAHVAVSFRDSPRVLHLRLVSATPGEAWDQSRCVALEFELRDVFRGDGPERIGDHIRVVVRQSTITAYTDRPAGPWWVVEQSLAPASEYVAFCAANGPAATLLRESCNVQPAGELLPDLRIIRDVEVHHAGLHDVVSRMRSACATTSYLLPNDLWQRYGPDAARDPAQYDEILSLLVEPSCSRIARGALLDAAYGAVGMAIAETSRPHVRSLARTLFRMLALPEASDVHDNIVGTYLPNLLGLTGGFPRRTPAEIFAGDAGARTSAERVLRAYAGRANAGPLRAWLGV